MNPIAIESAWKAALQPIVPDIAIHRGSSDEILSNEIGTIVVAVENLVRSAGPYWKCDVVITIDTPIHGPSPIDFQSGTFGQLLSFFNDASTVASCFPSDGVALNGFFLQSSANVPQDLRHIGEIRLIAGHSASV